MEHGGPIRARRGEAVQGDARIAPHLGGTVTTKERPQVGQGGLDGVPVREHAGRGGRFGRGRPPLRVARPPDQRVHQRAVHSDRREALDQAVRLEPLHPAQDGVRASTGPHRAGVLQHEAGDRVGVAPRLGMVDGGLRHVVRLAPRGGTVVERADHVRLAPLQLGHQQIPEQVVVAIPLPATVEWHDEQVSALESLQERARSLRVERRVAQRTAHAVEDRGAGQERHVRARNPTEELGAQVVAHEPVISAERHADVTGARSRLRGQRGKVQADRPTLRPADELAHVDGRRARHLSPSAARRPHRRPSPDRRHRAPRCRGAPAVAPPVVAMRCGSRSPAASPGGVRGRWRRWCRSTPGS